MGVHNGGKAQIVIGFHCVRRQGDYRLVSSGSFLRLANLRGGFHSLHFRHLYVHQDQVEAVFCRSIKRLVAVRRHSYAMASLLPQASGRPLIHHIVFREQDALHVRGVRRLVQRVAREQGNRALPLAGAKNARVDRLVPLLAARSSELRDRIGLALPRMLSTRAKAG
jgi:hypothetical protein